MSIRFQGSSALVVAAVLIASVAKQANAIESRPILKTYFESGDKPTQQQFATLIDSNVNFVDDKKLLGLKVYNPAVTYSIGDTVIFNRAGLGDTSPSSTPGVGFAPASELTGADAPTRDMATDFAGQYGFLPIQLEDSFGLVYNGYLQLGMDAPSGLPNDPPGIHVDYVVYNENAGEPITMALVPEPGSAAICLAGFLVLRRRTRA